MKILIGLGVWLGVSLFYFVGYIHGAVSARNAALDRKESECRETIK